MMGRSLALPAPWVGGLPRREKEQDTKPRVKVRPKRIPRSDTVATYLGIYLWHQEARGNLSEEEAERTIDALVASGVTPGPLMNAYSYFKGREITIRWLDLELQEQALEMYHEAELLVRPPSGRCAA